MKNDLNLIECKKYTGNLTVVKSIQYLIKNRYEKLFLAVIVHGSVATNEVISYSDFDGLLIVKEEYKDSLLLKRFIKKSMRHIYRFDPLQHHGWFIIYENELKNYPQTYFPYELFEYSRVIFPNKSLDIQIKLPDLIDYKIPFYKLANSVLKKMEIGFRPKNMYQLKSILSEFMLLPALYIQAKESQGVFKKKSFELTKKDFDEKDWNIMDLISGIRENWNYQLNPFQRWLMTQPNRFFRKITQKYFAPQILYIININLTGDFFKQITNLINKMKYDLEKSKVY